MTGGEVIKLLDKIERHSSQLQRLNALVLVFLDVPMTVISKVMRRWSDKEGVLLRDQLSSENSAGGLRSVRSMSDDPLELTKVGRLEVLAHVSAAVER